MWITSSYVCTLRYFIYYVACKRVSKNGNKTVLKAYLANRTLPRLVILLSWELKQFIWSVTNCLNFILITVRILSTSSQTDRHTDTVILSCRSWILANKNSRPADLDSVIPIWISYLDKRRSRYYWIWKLFGNLAYTYFLFKKT